MKNKSFIVQALAYMGIALLILAIFALGWSLAIGGLAYLVRFSTGK